MFTFEISGIPCSHAFSEYNLTSFLTSSLNFLFYTHKSIYDTHTIRWLNICTMRWDQSVKESNLKSIFVIVHNVTLYIPITVRGRQKTFFLIYDIITLHVWHIVNTYSLSAKITLCLQSSIHDNWVCTLKNTDSLCAHGCTCQSNGHKLIASTWIHTYTYDLYIQPVNNVNNDLLQQISLDKRENLLWKPPCDWLISNHYVENCVLCRLFTSGEG